MIIAKRLYVYVNFTVYSLIKQIFNVSNIIIQVKETPEMFGKLYAQVWPGHGMNQ